MLRLHHAYATALSKPFPSLGLLLSNQGEYAGLSVATVNCPDLYRLSELAAHDALAEADAAES